MANRAYNRAGCQKLRAGLEKSEFIRCELTTSTVLGNGDLVALSGATGSDARYPVVSRHSAGGAIFGIFRGLVNPTHADVAGYYDGVAADYGLIEPIVPDDIYVMQEDGVGGYLGAADVGKVADIVVSSASSTTGKSNMMIDSSTAATGGSASVVLLGISEEYDMVTGDVYTAWKIRFNELQAHDSFAGI